MNTACTYVQFPDNVSCNIHPFTIQETFAHVEGIALTDVDDSMFISLMAPPRPALWLQRIIGGVLSWKISG